MTMLCTAHLLQVTVLATVFTLISSATIPKNTKKPICSEEIIKPLNPNEEEYETILEPVDFERSPDGERTTVESECQNMPDNPEMSAGKFEGDMAGFEDKDIKEYAKQNSQLARNAINNQWRLWPNGKIPYTISSRYGSKSRRIIAEAMQEYSDRTCIEFVPRESQRDYVNIMPDDGCYSLVGRVGGKQIVSIDAGCVQFGTIVHELMHAVGFFHEQSRNDRDAWIDIVKSNVMNGAMDQFEKYSLRTISHLDTQYDYNSIMHYGPYAFSRNGRRTIRALKSGGSRMGQRDGFSNIDLTKIRKLYKCADVDPNPSGGNNNNNNNNKPKPATTVTTPDDGECEDKSWRCMFWSMAIFDYCKKYASMRESVCPKSCGTCDADQVAEINCKDNNSNCSKWGDQGYCTRRSYLDFMEEKCPKTCGKC